MIVILHNIRSLHNVGSVFRTADAVGAEKIYLTGITPKPVDRFGNFREQLAKVSLGAEKTLPWEHARSAATVLKKLKKEKYKIFAIEQTKKSTPYYKVALPLRSRTKNFTRAGSRYDHVALILGNEVRGLPQSILNCADKVLEIPMRGALMSDKSHPRHVGVGKESLNVAVSFAVVAYHLKYCSKTKK